MCGLVGIAGDISAHMASTVFKDMLDVCQVRGRDSTGVIHVSPNGKEYDWAKQVGPPFALYDGRSYGNRIEKASSVLIGHTRSKTVGEISVKNAHPFDYPDQGICGVHNGTLRSYHGLTGYNYQKVDSEILYNHLAVHGAEETFPILEGAFACVWWDHEAGRLNFIRNNDRPLYFAWSDDGRQLFWASETWMFGAVARKVKLYQDKDGDFFQELPPHVLWSYKINTSAKKDEKVITFCQPKNLPPKPKVTHMGNVGNGHSWNRGQWKKAEDGTWVEEGDKPANALVVVPPTGGQVADPFILGEREMDGIGLNDDLPTFLRSTTERIASDSSKPLSVISSKTSTEPTTESKSTEISNRKTLSLPAKSTSPPPIASNVVSLAASRASTTKSCTNTDTEIIGVTHRTVAGVPFISSKRTGNEWAVPMFLRNTGGVCTFCKTTYSDTTQVGEILDGKRFICKPCLTVQHRHTA